MVLYIHRYNISWTVDSHSPIEEYKLFFRRSSEEHELDNNIEQQTQPLQHSHHSNNLYPSYRGNYGNLHWPRNDWRDVVLPAMPLSHLYTQSMSYMIRGLEPDQQYEAKVQARFVSFFYSKKMLPLLLWAINPSELSTNYFSLLFIISHFYSCSSRNKQKPLRMEWSVWQIYIQHIIKWLVFKMNFTNFYTQFLLSFS